METPDDNTYRGRSRDYVIGPHKSNQPTGSPSDILYLPLGMNKFFFEKEKEFSFAYSGSEKKKILCSNMQTLKVQQQLQPQPQPH